MSQDPNYSQTVSLKLSEVLSDVGVNDRMVQKRRSMTLLKETILTTTQRLTGDNESIYMFGSQSEGTTTIGLDSDVDTLCCLLDMNVMQDWSEWQPGMFNLLMIQNETTSPGYCLLQLLRNDLPLPLSNSISKHRLANYLAVRGGIVLVKNTKNHCQGAVINGPAATKQGSFGICDTDFVTAFLCKSWPVEAKNWLTTDSVGGWPTEEMKRNCEATGCFVVPKSSKSGQYEDLEWRISTSQAERCLMFSLNITQIRCYILMKMILKTFIDPQCDGALSSFMCKTVLFHCLHNKSSVKWQEDNLLACLNCCLLELQTCVRHENCPHFIINRNNLIAGKVSSSNKNKLLEILQLIIQSEGRKLLEIPIDSLGLRLKRKMNMFVDEVIPTYPSPDILHSLLSSLTIQSEGRKLLEIPIDSLGQRLEYEKMNMFPDGVIPSYLPPDQLHDKLSSLLLINFASSMTGVQKKLFEILMSGDNKMVQQKLSESISTLDRKYEEINLKFVQKSAGALLKPMLCSSLGSVIASNDINTNNTLSPAALDWLSEGSSSDVSSGRLKLASALYCDGDMHRTEIVLRNTEDLYDIQTVESVCGCYATSRSYYRPGFREKSSTGNEELVKHVTAFCVRFLLCEIKCVPKELQYEMFRSTNEEKLHRNELDDFWMDWAVVDSLPYLYFLQYKTYRHLQRAAEQYQALKNLEITTNAESNLGHRETALNLLGQCMEQENSHMDALRCYTESLHIRSRNNVAKIHICRLLNELVNRQKL